MTIPVAQAGGDPVGTAPSHRNRRRQKKSSSANAATVPAPPPPPIPTPMQRLFDTSREVFSASAPGAASGKLFPATTPGPPHHRLALLAALDYAFSDGVELAPPCSALAVVARVVPRWLPDPLLDLGWMWGSTSCC